MLLKDRIAKALEEAGIKPIELARRAMVSRGAVSLWLDGSTKSIKGKNLTRTAAALGVDAHWLATGEGRMSPTTMPSHAIPTSTSIPLLSWIRAGDFCEAPGQFTSADAEEMLPAPIHNTGKNVFAVRVRGDSMDAPDGYREGEIVFIDPDITPSPGRDVLAKHDAKLTLKRYKEDEEGPYLLQLNGNIIIRPTGEWHVCGVVIFAGRKI